MSKQELWKDPITGRRKPFKVGGAGLSPTFRDEDVFEQLPPLRPTYGRHYERFGSTPSTPSLAGSMAAPAAEVEEQNNRYGSSMTATEWQSYVEERALGLNAVTASPEPVEYYTAPAPPIQRGRRPRLPGATARGTRRPAHRDSSVSRVSQGARERAERISRLLRNINGS